MKSLLTLVFISFSFITVTSQSYFWVGDEGSWSDLNHWATSSGGSDLHTILPNDSSDVFFDEHSFTMTGQKVFIDQDSFSCNNLTLKGIDFNPTFQSNDYYYKLFIHGDLTLTSEVLWGIAHNYLVGNVQTKIHIEKAYMGGFLILNPQDSLAKFELLADIEAQKIELLNGHFDSNGFDLFVREIRIGSFTAPGSPFWQFNDSQVRASRFLSLKKGDLDAGTSDITIFDGPDPATNIFFGGGNHYHFMTFEGEIDRIKDNNSYVQFTALPASILALEHGEIQTAEKFIFNGNSSSPISISSRKEGEAAILEQKSGQVNGNYLILKDNSAIGGADFNAFNSINDGNVTGWDIQVTAPEDYYWVGNSGLWSDLGQWAKSSGGSDFHIELPSAIDDVYFDANSVNEAESVIEVDLESILLNNFSTLDLMVGTDITVANGKFTIYGDVEFGSNVNVYFKEVEFAGDSVQSIKSNGSSFGFGSDLKFSGSGNIEMRDDLHADEISISNGVFNSNGHGITTIGRFRMTTLNHPKINLDNSNVVVKTWFPSGPTLNLSIANTKISCAFTFYGEAFNYDEVILTGRNWVYGPMSTSKLTFAPGSEILIFPGDTIKFIELEANGNSTDSITIASREDGAAGYLFCDSGDVKGTFLSIRDNQAIGGAIFTAENSYIHENSVSGWMNLSSATEELTIEQAKCFPNPADDHFRFIVQDANVEKVMVFDIYGRIISRFYVSGDGEEVRVSTIDWPDGIYLIAAEGGAWTQQLVIARND